MRLDLRRKRKVNYMADSGKVLELRRKIRETEQDNEKLTQRLARSTRQMMRLRLEKALLVEKFMQMNPEAGALSPTSVDGTPHVNV